MFNNKQMAPIIESSRAGNTDLEFNMNSSVRKFSQIFIVQTEPSGAATAKQLDFKLEKDGYEEENPNVPPIVFTSPQRGYSKDCWLIDIGEGEVKAV
jgi:hypothetical protein